MGNRRIVVRFPAWVKDFFFLLKSDRTGNGATDGFQPAFSTDVKRPGCKADRSLPSCVEITNEWIYTYFPPCFHNTHRNKYAFLKIGECEIIVTSVS